MFGSGCWAQHFRPTNSNVTQDAPIDITNVKFQLPEGGIVCSTSGKYKAESREANLSWFRPSFETWMRSMTRYNRKSTV